MFEMSMIMESRAYDFDEKIQNILKTIPKAFKYPNQISVCIHINDSVYESPDKQTSGCVKALRKLEKSGHFVLPGKTREPKKWQPRRLEMSVPDPIGLPDEISDFIEKSIQESDITISVISKNSLGSPWVMVETLETLLSETFDKRKRYIPVMIDDCLFKDKFQSVLIKNIEKNIDEIVDEISHLSKKYVQTDSLYARQKRLINLRSNIDIILFRLKEVLVANFITEEEYLKNFSRLIHFITQ